MFLSTAKSKYVATLVGVCCVMLVASATYSIPEDQLNTEKIYYGNSASFENAAAVKIETLVKTTPEYDEIKKKKIERGTGKYWILISQAQERCVKAITEVAEASDYDLVAEDGYLDALKPAIPSVDITKTVAEQIEG